nr:penicillin-binding transpeptidase domain-containing protein [Pseudomonadota bacterium]
LLAKGLSAASWQELARDPAHPLINKVIAGQYAPGSTFKMMTGLAGLDAGTISARHRVHCSGHVSLGSHRFHCWRREGHGSLDMVDALAQSCDVFFYDVAQKTGIDRMAAIANRFGLGQKLGIDLPGEKDGAIPTQAWKRNRFGERWQQGETLVSAIGQGYVLATPLQIAAMMARLANGGKAVVPRVIREIEGEPPLLPEWPDMGLDPDHLDLVMQGLRAVTQDARGTARGSQIRTPGREMGGKTGTSQVRRITMAERARGVISNDKLEWASRDHALFTGYAPLNKPRMACCVIVEHGGGGSSVAAPIARDILDFAQGLTTI